MQVFVRTGVLGGGFRLLVEEEEEGRNVFFEDDGHVGEGWKSGDVPPERR